ncbi:MAG: hypothetical protein ACO3SO_04840 [Luteolibacter sp.]
MKRLLCLLPIGIVLASCLPIERGPVHGQGWGGGALQAGQFARTIIDNTSFFRQLPLSGAQADLLLQRHTSVRLIQVDGGYSKVELDNGEIGFVLTAMLEPNAPRLPDASKGFAYPDGAGVDAGADDRNALPPVGPGMPDMLPPTIDPEP